MKSWGLWTGLDFNNCDEDIVQNKSEIKKLIVDLCKFIRMKRYGETIIYRFGKNDLEGFTAIQMIETSSIVVHFVDKDNSAYFDIFSCKKYKPKKVAEFLSKKLDTNEYTMRYYNRGVK